MIQYIADAFTDKAELCGHATLATSFVLHRF